MHYFGNKTAKEITSAGIFLAVIILFVASGIWAFRHFKESPPYVDPEKYPIRGIDISRHNGEIDFNKVAESGMEFVFIKASEGKDYRDPQFSKNYDKAKEAGLKTGAYHFFRFDAEGADQAENFLKAVSDRPLELGHVIDIEKAGNPEGYDPEDIKRKLSAMVEYMNLEGHRVMIYTNLEGYYDYIEDILPGTALWICSFREHPIYAEWTFWQFDHHGKIDGIKEEVDINVFCGNREEWQSFLNGDIWPFS